MAHAHGFVIIDVITQGYPSEILKKCSNYHARRRPCIKVLSQGMCARKTSKDTRKKPGGLGRCPQGDRPIITLLDSDGDGRSSLPARGGVAFASAVKTMSASVIRSQSRGRKRRNPRQSRWKNKCVQSSPCRRPSEVLGWWDFFGVKWSLPAKMLNVF